jgi:hypothetical protein
MLLEGSIDRETLTKGIDGNDMLTKSISLETVL